MGSKKTFIRNKIITDFGKTTYLSNGVVIWLENGTKNYQVWHKKNGEYEQLEENSKLGYYALLKKYSRGIYE